MLLNVDRLGASLHGEADEAIVDAAG